MGNRVRLVIVPDKVTRFSMLLKENHVNNFRTLPKSAERSFLGLNSRIAMNLVRMIFGVIVFFVYTTSNAVPITLTNNSFENGLGDGNLVTTTGSGTGGNSAATVFWQWANSLPGATTAHSPDVAVDGTYSAHIWGNLNNGIGQYHSADAGIYTASAWFYAVEGAAKLALFDQGGSRGSWSNATASLNRWEYLTVTFDLHHNVMGPVLYAAENNSEFYTDAVWVNQGTSSTSIWDPSTGFNPNNSVPEPSTLTLLGLGLAGIGFSRRKA